jgi:hypothetical protein
LWSGLHNITKVTNSAPVFVSKVRVFGTLARLLNQLLRPASLFLLASAAVGRLRPGPPSKRGHHFHLPGSGTARLHAISSHSVIVWLIPFSSRALKDFDTFFDVEPISGATFHVEAYSQLSVFMEPIPSESDV